MIDRVLRLFRRYFCCLRASWGSGLALNRRGSPAYIAASTAALASAKGKGALFRR
jgi:hypothetical protein